MHFLPSQTGNSQIKAVLLDLASVGLTSCLSSCLSFCLTNLHHVSRQTLEVRRLRSSVDQNFSSQACRILPGRQNIQEPERRTGSFYSQIMFVTFIKKTLNLLNLKLQIKEFVFFMTVLNSGWASHSSHVFLKTLTMTCRFLSLPWWRSGPVSWAHWGRERQIKLYWSSLHTAASESKGENKVIQ